MSLVIAVVALAVASSAGRMGGLISALLILGLGLGGLSWARLQYLKEHPPDPELQHKPFWRR